MAEAVDNTDTITSSLSSSAADDVEFGFKRPEMYKEKLAGTVDPPFDRHVFLCYGSYDSWPSRVESSDSDPLPKLLSGALKTRKNEIGVKTRLTVCEGREGTEFSDGDVLIFPEMIKYRGLKDSDVDNFVEDVIVSGKPWASGVPEVLAGSHVFVCAHANRDKRCGVCGPVLIEKFEEEIEIRGLKDQVFVSACSHIGGHKYAGNIIIFSPDAEGKIAGHWYGYVTPDDVPEMLDQHIGKGEIIDRLWRGQMGVYVEPAEKAKEQKIPNGKDEEKSKKKHKGEKKVQVENGVVASCCQGANGVSCCQDGSSEAKETAEVKGKKGLGKCSSWMGKWEQSEVLTAVGVVGAVATIAVAYSFYRRCFHSYVDENGLLDVDLDGLKARILYLFNLSPDANLVLTYIDEDNDNVALVDEEDFYYAIEQCLNPMMITAQFSHIVECLAKLKSGCQTIVASEIDRKASEFFETSKDTFSTPKKSLGDESVAPIQKNYQKDLNKGNINRNASTLRLDPASIHGAVKGFPKHDPIQQSPDQGSSDIDWIVHNYVKRRNHMKAQQRAKCRV
ncbi:hypothetical protein RHSIM_Rhsim10G0016700 [Rhododendron simsii]|uniref:Uncharacterized protein n=1 Tax=Rhododendron simsii TaxID=118357 RepID=A0A834GBX1_RHOSS|nr:hypothetical protein RHSIM_Rhsim10G0016700 [Rhododendron simsii]